MASQGPLNGSTFISDPTVGTIAWSSPSSAQTSNDVRAQAGLPDTAISEYLKVTGFSFSIPSNATVDGIAVEIERSKQALGGGNIRDSQVKIVKGDVVSGNNLGATGANWPATTDAYRRYPLAGDTELWGLTWTPADINASDFGMVISAIDLGSFPQSNARVDHIRITVFYTVIAPMYPYWYFKQ